MLRLVFPLFAAALGGCGVTTDPATRIAYDIEAKVGQLASEEDATFVIRHQTPSLKGQCDGPYKVQFDEVGALIIWCNDSAGQNVSSHSTSYHARFVDTRETRIVEKARGSTRSIRIERNGGRPVITEVY